MFNVLEPKLSVTLIIQAVDLEGVLTLAHEALYNISEGNVAGIIGGGMGQCQFSVDPLARVVEQRDEAAKQDGAGESPKSLRTED